MINFIKKECYEFDDLLNIMDVLRSEHGCPWDREQNHKSIRRSFIEEVYEACEAIDDGDDELLCEELGDVLLQVVFHAHIARTDGRFDIKAVTDGICKKLILRHPHVFSDAVANDSAQVLENWEQIKKVEKKQDTVTQSMQAVAKSLPALIYAEKVQHRAKKVGFEWNSVDGALDKIEEEAAELREAVSEQSNIAEELGDLLFAAVNAARFVGVDPEAALMASSAKFIKRFSYVESMADGGMESMTLEEMNELWNAAKLIERK